MWSKRQLIGIYRFTQFLKDTWLFVVKVCKELEAADRDSVAVAKCKTFAIGTNAIRMPKFVQKVQKISDNFRKSINTITKEFKISRYSFGRIVPENLHYKSYTMQRGQFTSAKMKNNCLICAKLMMNKLKHQETGMLCFFSNKKNFDQDWKVNWRNDIWSYRDLKDIATVRHTSFHKLW